MNFLSYVIPLIITISGALIPVNALNSKSNLGKTFFTDEQKIKVRYFNTVILSFIMAFAFSYFYLVINSNTSGHLQIGTSEITSAIVWGIWVFLIFLMVTSPLLKWIDNFFIKNHLKYKVILSEDKAFYIIRMHDKDTCICSKNPNAEFVYQGEYMLISMQEILGKRLVEEKVPKPPRSTWSKIFNL
jgi:hypothetical protein